MHQRTQLFQTTNVKKVLYGSEHNNKPIRKGSICIHESRRSEVSNDSDPLAPTSTQRNLETCSLHQQDQATRQL